MKNDIRVSVWRLPHLLPYMCAFVIVMSPILDAFGATLQNAAAHLFISVEGTSLDSSTRKMLQELKPGGVVLLKQNVTDEQQTQKLVHQIKQAVGMGTNIDDFPLIAVDQEGGSINRLQLPDAPSAANLGKGTVEMAEKVGRSYGRACRKRGIGVVLAPVLDVFDPKANKVIDSRSFGDKPENVAAFGLAFSRGLLAEGVIPVAKHFPGHGSACQDSHERLAVVTKTPQEMIDDLYPFRRAIEEGIPGIMTGHIACKYLTSEDDRLIPASRSKYLIAQWLRGALGFDGVVITDDMSMRGAGNDTRKGVVEALEAGNDAVIFFTNDPLELQALCAEISRSIQSGVLNEHALEKSRQRLDQWSYWLRMKSMELKALPSVEDESGRFALNCEELGIARQRTTLANRAMPPEQVSNEDKTSSAEEAAVEPLTPNTPPKPTDDAKTEIAVPLQTGAPEKAPSEKAPACYTYKVTKGDTLNKLARQFKTTAQTIQQYNHLTDANITIGQSLQIPPASYAQMGGASAPLRNVSDPELQKEPPAVRQDMEIVCADSAQVGKVFDVTLHAVNRNSKPLKGFMVLEVEGKVKFVDIPRAESVSIIAPGQTMAFYPEGEYIGKSSREKPAEYPAACAVYAPWLRNEGRSFVFHLIFEEKGAMLIHARCTFKDGERCAANLPVDGVRDQSHLPTVTKTVDVQ